MNGEPLVSVIVPVYKAENTLGYCVKSILNQSYKNIEIILVDDGSPDRSGSLCDEIAENDLRIKVIHKQNGGVSDARNCGIEAANGTYMMFVDNDDLLTDGCIQVMVATAEETNADIVQGVIKHIASIEEAKSVNPSEYEKNTLTPEEISARSEYRTDVWGKLYSAAIAKNCRFPVGHYAEDIYYNGMVLTDPCIQTIVNIDYPVYYYMSNASSASHGWDAPHFIDMEKTVNDLYFQICNRTCNKNIIRNYLLLFFSQYCSFKYNLIIRSAYSSEIKKTFQKDRKELLPELRETNASIMKKAAYLLLSAYNPIYRFYVFHHDPTMRVYEKNVKEQLKRRPGHAKPFILRMEEK